MKKLILLIIFLLFIVSCFKYNINKNKTIISKIKDYSKLINKIENYYYIYDNDKNNITASLGQLLFIIKNNKVEEIHFISDYKSLKDSPINVEVNFKNNILFLYGPIKCSVDLDDFKYKPFNNLTSMGWEITQECPRFNDILLVIEHLEFILKTYMHIDYSELKKQDF